MNRVVSRALVVAGLVLTLGGAVSWGQVPATNDTSDANRNTGGGRNTLYRNTTGGWDALLSHTTGIANTATGEEALFNNTSGGYNTAVGSAALNANTTGHENTALGYQALVSNTGTFNIGLGVGAGANLTSGDNNIYLGNTGVSTESHTMRLGSSNQTQTFIAG